MGLAGVVMLLNITNCPHPKMCRVRFATLELRLNYMNTGGMFQTRRSKHEVRESGVHCICTTHILDARSTYLNYVCYLCLRALLTEHNDRK